jgi:hypothetical protein
VPIHPLSDPPSPGRFSRLLRRALLTLSPLALAAFPGLLLAQAQSGSAFAEQLSLKVAPFLGSPITVQSGPLPMASGTSYHPFSQNQQAGSVLASTGLTGKLLETGLLLVSTQGGGGEIRSASSVEQTQLQLVSLLTLQADAIESTAHVAGCGSALDGSTHLVNVRLRGPLGLSINVPANPAPNTVILDVAGVRVVLNEQIAESSSGGLHSLTVNAVHVSVNALLGIGLLSGDVVLSQSQVQVVCRAISG